jgi:hypothetical protein
MKTLREIDSDARITAEQLPAPPPKSTAKKEKAPLLQAVLV